jgi:hypothetical protein
VAQPDSTIRPAADPTQCLTNVRLGPAAEMMVYNVSVAPCDDRVEQHWAVGVQNPTDKVRPLAYMPVPALTHA